MRHTIESSLGWRPHQRGLRSSVIVPVRRSMLETRNGPFADGALAVMARLNVSGDFVNAFGSSG